MVQADFSAQPPFEDVRLGRAAISQTGARQRGQLSALALLLTVLSASGCHEEGWYGFQPVAEHEKIRGRVIDMWGVLASYAKGESNSLDVPTSGTASSIGLFSSSEAKMTAPEVVLGLTIEDESGQRYYISLTHQSEEEQGGRGGKKPLLAIAHRIKYHETMVTLPRVVRFRSGKGEMHETQLVTSDGSGVVDPDWLELEDVKGGENAENGAEK